MENSFIYIIVALGISIVINIILKRIGISQIIGYILTGIVISYAFNLHEFGHSHKLGIVADFGIVFLMFTIGLEISLQKMGSMKKEIFVNGIMQVGAISLISFIITRYVINLDIESALIVSLALSLSSTAVVLTYLKSSKEIHTIYGQNATGILIFQDIAVIPILILISFLTTKSNESIYVILGDTFLSVILVIAILFIVGKRVVAWLLHFSASSGLDELFMGSVLFIVMTSSLFASFMGFTYSLGAFIAGMIIAETKYHYRVESEIAPFKDLLLGTFFVVVGMKVDLVLFFENIKLIIEVFIAILSLKTLFIYLLLRLSYSKANALKTALSISQVGEFSFVIFSLSTSGHLIEEHISSLLVLVVILSMIITPFFIPHLSKFVDKFITEKSVTNDFSKLKERKDHVIVCGYGVVGKFVTTYLEDLDSSFVVIDNSNKHVKEGLNNNLEIYLGDASKRSILEAMNIEEAAAIIVTLDNIEKKRLICESVLNYSKNANLIVKITSLEEKEKLKDLDITTIVDGKVEVARVLVERMVTCQLKL